MEKTYLKRKIDSKLSKRLKTPNHSPALIVGVRQCGKTESIKKFAYENFKNVIYINFWNNPEFIDIFNASINVDDIIYKLQFAFELKKFEPYSTVIILDEIQDCPTARLSLKNFKIDNRYEVIATGSYIGLNSSSKSGGVPIPVGAEDIIQMYTLDFEEYLWANGISEEMILSLEKYFDGQKPLPVSIHQKMHKLFKEYISIGGYPEVVREFIVKKDFLSAFNKNKNLTVEIKNDPAKRKNFDLSPTYTSFEIDRIQNAFDLIANFMVDDNKRFIVSKINGGNGSQKNEAIDYLINSNIAFKVNNLTVPALPLKLSAIYSQFKLFYSDIGLLMAECGFDTINGLINGTLGMKKGHLFESVVAESLYKNDIPLYYFHKNSGLEIDFVISYKGISTLLEVKATNGNTKASKTVLKHPEHYGVTKLIKITESNISYENEVLTIPYYLTFMLGKKCYSFQFH